MATYNSDSIFGLAVTIVHELNPPAEQLNAFFGVTGTQSLYGGLRGRVFLISGLLWGTDMGALNTAEAVYLNYCDGKARTLVDTRGRTFPSVLLKPLQPQGRVLQDGRGLFLPYRGVANGLA
jgi:hypothetical protein